jgi:hypothetical protein
MPLYLAYIQTIALATIAVSLTILGKFLYTSFNQQLATKQTEIDTLNARIEHLEGMTAPALADQLKKLAPVVDEYAKKVAEQETRLSSMGPATLAVAQTSYRLGITRTALEAVGALLVIFKKGDGSQKSTMQNVEEMTGSLMSTLAEAISGKTPDLPHVEAILALISQQYPDFANHLRSLTPPVDK